MRRPLLRRLVQTEEPPAKRAQPAEHPQKTRFTWFAEARLSHSRRLPECPSSLRLMEHLAHPDRLM